MSSHSSAGHDKVRKKYTQWKVWNAHKIQIESTVTEFSGNFTMVIDACSFSWNSSQIISSFCTTCWHKSPQAFLQCTGSFFFLFRAGQLVSRHQFEATVNQGWVSWGFDLFFKRPISWSFGKVFGSSNNVSGEYIMLDAVKVKIINLFIVRNFANQVFWRWKMAKKNISMFFSVHGRKYTSVFRQWRKSWQ